MSSRAVEHLKYLSTIIGPRGSTTLQEREAATYAQEQFKEAGLEPIWDSFMAPISGWKPFVFVSLSGILAIAFSFFPGWIFPPIAFLLSGTALIQMIAELYFFPNLFQQMVPKKLSQNVWTKVPPTKESKQILLLAAHLDSHRTPWAFAGPLNFILFQRISTVAMIGIILLPFYFLAISIIFFVDIETSLIDTILGYQWVILVFIPFLFAMFLIAYQADKTPFTHGANDNASGAGILLSLAQQLSQSPLDNIEIWALCSGCEEVGVHGMQAFIRKYNRQLQGVKGISIDNVGGKGAGVCFTSKEGMIFQFSPDQMLFAEASSLAKSEPTLNAYTKPFTVLHTEGTCMMVNKIPTLSFVGITEDGRLPHWHQKSDTFDNIDPQVVENTEKFILTLIRKLDQKLKSTTDTSQ